jgi:hypothetical protein
VQVSTELIPLTWNKAIVERLLGCFYLLLNKQEFSMSSLKPFIKDYLKVYPSIIGVLCLNTLFTQIWQFSWMNLLVALIGLTGVTLYFFKKSYFKYFLNFWTYVQMPVFVLNGFVLEIVQVFNYSLYFFFELRNGGMLKIGFNALALIYLPLNYRFYHLLYAHKLIGQEIKLLSLKPMHKVKDLNYMLPASGSILGRVTLDKEKDWLMVLLNEYAGKQPDQLIYVAIRATDMGIFRPKGNRLVRVLKLNEEYDPNKEKYFKTHFTYMGVARGY